MASDRACEQQVDRFARSGGRAPKTHGAGAVFSHRFGCCALAAIAIFLKVYVRSDMIMGVEPDLVSIRRLVAGSGIPWSSEASRERVE
jgi:hypothetical protein